MAKLNHKCRHWSKVPSSIGSPVLCAFDSRGNWKKRGNWQCALVNALRDHTDRGWFAEPNLKGEEVYSEDNHAGVIPFDGRFLVLSYYKHRGATDGAWVVDGRVLKPLTEKVAFEFVKGLNDGKLPKFLKRRF